MTDSGLTELGGRCENLKFSLFQKILIQQLKHFIIHLTHLLIRFLDQMAIKSIKIHHQINSQNWVNLFKSIHKKFKINVFQKQKIK
jgi:hypothetical protein